MQRLDKLAASAFNISRAQAQNAVRKGLVSVGGEVCRSPEKKFPENSELSMGGVTGAYEKYVYIMMDKPEGYLSATEDTRDPTVTELLPEELTRRRLGICGRLDKDTTGLLLITDDGELNHRLTSPRYHLDKVYIAGTDRPAGEDDVRAFAEGMDLGDFTARPARLEILDDDGMTCRVTISEGKFHQIKRMFAQRGIEVLSLRRVAMGGILLDDTLGPGGFRRLTQAEREYLTDKCGIKQEIQNKNQKIVEKREMIQ